MSKKPAYIILFIYICFVKVNLFCQSIPSIQFNTFNGFPISNAYCVIQLKDSTYYIGTNNGLIHYNGNSFKNEVVKNIKGTQSIIYASVLNDSLLIYSSFKEGLFIYNYKTKISERFKLDISNPNVFQNSTTNIDQLFMEAHNKVLSNEETIFILNNFKGSAQSIIRTVLAYNITSRNLEIIYDVKSIKKYDSKLFYLSKDNIYKYSNKKILYCSLSSLHLKNIEDFCVSNDSIYCVANNKLYTIHNNKIIKTDSINGYAKKVIDLERDLYGNFWFLTADYSFYKYYNNELMLVEDGTYKYNNIYIDHNQNLFMTSYTDGLNVYYNTYMSNFGVKDGVKNKNINNIKKINNAIYICTNNGLYLLKDNKVNYITFNNFDLPYVYDVVQQNDKVLVLSSGVLKKQKIDATHLSFNRNVVLKLKNNWMLCSGWNNEITFDEDFSIIKSPQESYKITLPDTFSKKNYVIGFHQFSDSIVFANTNIGVYKINIYTKAFEKISAINERVNDICFNKKNNQYLFCTDNIIYSFANNNWSKISQIHSQVLNKVTSCKFDLQGRLWVATANGVYITSKHECRKLTSEMGLLSNEVLCLYLDSIANKMYIGTNNGFSIIDIGQFDKKISNPPLVFVKSIITNNDTIYNCNNHTFFPNQNSMVLCLNSMFYPNLKCIKIKYSLDGIVTETDYSDKIIFTSLSGEKHTFKISATADGLNWSKPFEINFEIKPQIYNSVWFYLLSLLIGLVIIILFAQKTIRKNRKENELKFMLQEENTKLKFQALNASVNPHFIFNALYSIQNFVYNNKGNIASDYLGKLSRLIRITLEQAEEIEVTLKTEMEKLNFYIQLEKMRFEEKIDIKIINEIKTNPDLIKIPNMIIQPLIENAIIHGLNSKPNNGIITVVFYETNTQVKISIEDNGVGINRSIKMIKTSHKSIGLSNVKARISLIKDASIDIVDKSDISENYGTIITVTLPKNHE